MSEAPADTAELEAWHHARHHAQVAYVQGLDAIDAKYEAELEAAGKVWQDKQAELAQLRHDARIVAGRQHDTAMIQADAGYEQATGLPAPKVAE